MPSRKGALGKRLLTLGTSNNFLSLIERFYSILQITWTSLTKPVEQSLSCEPNSFSGPSHPISVSPTWIVLSHLSLRLPIGHFPSGFPIKILCENPLSPQTCPMFRPFYRLNNISWAVWTKSLLIAQFLKFSSRFLFPRPK